MTGYLFRAWRAWMIKRGSYKHVARYGDAYLDRFYLLRLGGFALFLHRFYSSDADYLHDHPWPWGRYILSGGYFESHQDEVLHWRPAGTFTWRRDAHVLHRVDLKRGTEEQVWTLFWHFKRERPWGFLDADGSYRAAEAVGAQDAREMTGWLFPRFVAEEAAE